MVQIGWYRVSDDRKVQEVIAAASLDKWCHGHVRGITTTTRGRIVGLCIISTVHQEQLRIPDFMLVSACQNYNCSMWIIAKLVRIEQFSRYRPTVCGYNLFFIHYSFFTIFSSFLTVYHCRVNKNFQRKSPAECTLYNASYGVFLLYVGYSLARIRYVELFKRLIGLHGQKFRSINRLWHWRYFFTYTRRCTSFDWSAKTIVLLFNQWPTILTPQ